MVVHQDSLIEPQMNPETHFVHVKNQVKEIRIAKEDRLSRKRKNRSSEESNTSLVDQKESKEARDLAELRRVYDECKRVLNYIEKEYGQRLGLSSHKSSDQEPRSVNRRVIFDESGCGHDVDCIPAGLPDDVSALNELLQRGDVKGDWRLAVCAKLREVRARLADEMRVERRALQIRLRDSSSTELSFVGSNLHTLPGYAVTKQCKSDLENS